MKRGESRREESRWEESRREESRREESRREELEENMKEEKIDCVKERACILQTFYLKNSFKNTLNFKVNLFIKLYDIFEKI